MDTKLDVGAFISTGTRRSRHGDYDVWSGVLYVHVPASIHVIDGYTHVIEKRRYQRSTRVWRIAKSDAMDDARTMRRIHVEINQLP